MVVIVRALLVCLTVEFLVLVPAVLVLVDRHEVQFLAVRMGSRIVLMLVPMLVRVGVRMFVRMGMHQLAVPMLV
jgi:hypothetical protein